MCPVHLYIKYIPDYSHLDYSTLAGRIRVGQGEKYRELLSNFVGCSSRNHLRLNMSKTKEMVIDFRRRRRVHCLIRILAEEVETVESCKYLGLHLDTILDWRFSTDAVYGRGMSRLTS